MVELRSAKRRRISNNERDQHRDVEIPETPPSAGVDGAYPAAMDVDDSELDAVRSDTPSKSSRRQATAAASTTENDHVKDEDTNSQSVRASSRRRKAPARYEDELQTIETPRRSRLSSTTPSKTTVSGSGARKGRKKTQADDGESQKGPAVVVKSISTRNKRRGSTNDTVQSRSDASPESESQPPEVESTLVDDGLDDKYDPVAVQLQEMLQPQDEVHEEINQPIGLPEYAEKFKNLSESEFRQEIVDLSKLVLEKVTGKRLSPLKGLDAEYQKVYQLVEQTVTAGEGNSMLLMGSRGSGKTSMVESIIASLLKQHGDDFHVVRLNGFFHTDDRLSLREIWRQLGREMETEDDASKINSYADTMATLLALLSHPEELLQGTDRSNGLTTAKSVVIILDEFDLFATHPRQTLLYNLFDIAQARKAPLAVLGLTTKVDVTETLEKRVKSRFSHRYVYLPLARSFEAFSDACLSSLMVEMHEAESHGFSRKNPKKAQQLLMAWQEYLKGLWQDKDFEIHLQRLYHQTKSVKDFLSSALLPLSDFHRSLLDVDSDSSTDLNVPTPRDFAAQSLTCPDPAPLPFPVTMTGSTSATSLPLSLLLAATRLTALYDRSSDAAGSQSLALSFPAAYTEYVRLLTAAKATAAAQGASATGGRVWGRDVSREAWEKLVNWGLVLPLGSGNGTTDGTMFKVEVSYEEVADMVGGGGGSLGKWWRD